MKTGNMSPNLADNMPAPAMITSTQTKKANTIFSIDWIVQSRNAERPAQAAASPDNKPANYVHPPYPQASPSPPALIHNGLHSPSNNAFPAQPQPLNSPSPPVLIPNAHHQQSPSPPHNSPNHQFPVDHPHYPLHVDNSFYNNSPPRSPDDILPPLELNSPGGPIPNAPAHVNQQAPLLYHPMPYPPAHRHMPYVRPIIPYGQLPTNYPPRSRSPGAQAGRPGPIRTGGSPGEVAESAAVMNQLQFLAIRHHQQQQQQQYLAMQQAAGHLPHLPPGHPAAMVYHTPPPSFHGDASMQFTLSPWIRNRMMPRVAFAHGELLFSTIS